MSESVAEHLTPNQTEERIRELQAERDAWKDRAERPWANARKTWEGHCDELRAERKAIRGKTIEECLADLIDQGFPEEGKVCNRIRALAQAETSDKTESGK